MPAEVSQFSSVLGTCQTEDRSPFQDRFRDRPNRGAFGHAPVMRVGKNQSAKFLPGPQEQQRQQELEPRPQLQPRPQRPEVRRTRTPNSDRSEATATRGPLVSLSDASRAEKSQAVSLLLQG